MSRSAILAVDIANYAGYLNDATLDAWKVAGVQMVIASCEMPEITRQQLSVALAKGFRIAAYVFLYWSLDCWALVRQAWQACANLPIEFMAIDCEQEPVDVDTHTVLTKINEAVHESLQHGPTWLYSRREWWQGIAPNMIFPTCKNWVASYLSNNRTDPQPEEWPEPLTDEGAVDGWQYAADVDLGGVKVDLSLMRI